MDSQLSVAIYDEENNELLGYVMPKGTLWAAATTFGYEFAVLPTKHEAEHTVKKRGLLLLKSLWQYYDTQDGAWHDCVLREVRPHEVVISRTDTLGNQDKRHIDRIVIKNPDPSNLIPSA